MNSDIWASSIDLGEKDLTLLTLVSCWASFVLEFQAQNEQPEAFPEEQRWTPDDLFAVWHWRGIVQNCLEEHGLVDAEGLEFLTVIDEYFKSVSAEGNQEIADSYGEDCFPGPLDELEWWWSRIPKSGPVLDELMLWLSGADCCIDPAAGAGNA